MPRRDQILRGACLAIPAYLIDLKRITLTESFLFTMIEDIQLTTEEHMTNTVEHTREQLVTIRTGRANPAMFNGLMAEYYGSPTPITQMATISVPEPRMMLIKPYEQSMIHVIEESIRNSDLGVNPTNDGQVLRVTIPQLTEERRRDLVKVAKTKGEDGKIAIRNVRRKAMEAFKKLQKDGEVGEDEVIAAEKEMEKTTASYIEQIDKLVAHKESELMEV